jgi:hypothetical protein
MKYQDFGHPRPVAAQAALLLQRIQVDEIVAEGFSIEVTPSPKRSRKDPEKPVGPPKYTMRATIEREITHGEYLALTRPLLGTPKSKLAQAPSTVREEYRLEYLGEKPGMLAPRLWVHPDEIDRLAHEIEAAIVRIIA